MHQKKSQNQYCQFLVDLDDLHQYERIRAAFLPIKLELLDPVLQYSYDKYQGELQHLAHQYL